MRRPAAALLLGALPVAWLLAALPAAAQPDDPVVVEGNGIRRSYDCEGRDVVVRGERNVLVFTGGCRSLDVQGNVNAIRAELAPAARVMLRGEVLDLSWTQLGAGPAPRIREEGQRISIEQARR